MSANNKITIGLLGNPNCGKTTVFNALTGSRQRVGNWPGVTVERKSGVFTSQGQTVEVVDLPGVYSLISASPSSSIDERLVCECIQAGELDAIINVLDASNLERNLYLTLQLLERGIPVILALNMMDVARQRGVEIAVQQLGDALGCPVLLLEARKGKGIKELKSVCAEYAGASHAVPVMAQWIKPILADGNGTLCPYEALRLLEGDLLVQSNASPELLTDVARLEKDIRVQYNEDPDIIIADARYTFIHELMTRCVTKKTTTRTTWSTRIDNVVLNRYLGIPIFLLLMYSMFVFAIKVGGAFQEFFNVTADVIFVQGVAHILNSWSAPAWLTALAAEGIGKGINTTLTFIPVIGAMFLALAFLEDSGYMARAAFIVDRAMRAMGLPGKAFVPMIVGFGCNVPAVMGARTLENQRDRILTVMMSPFMSCGARLAIYAVFTAAFFPSGGQNIVFGLYLIGILMAVLTGLLLRQTILKGEPAPLVMELPPYHVPRLKTLCLHAWQRLKNFVFRAGKLIVPVCVILGVLNSMNIDGTLNNGEGGTQSILSMLGQSITPIFTPMGLEMDNWPATVGLVTGILAKEVVVGTLNTLYSQLGHLASVSSVEAFDLWGGLKEALASIPANLSALGSVISHPFVAPTPDLTQGVYGLMYERFDGQKGAIAYLLFVLLYFPCVSTVAAMARELNYRWALFSMAWTTGVAYGVAVAFYQIATFAKHPAASLSWVLSITIVFLLFITMIKRSEKYNGFA